MLSPDNTSNDILTYNFMHLTAICLGYCTVAQGANSTPECFSFCNNIYGSPDWFSWEIQLIKTKQRAESDQWDDSYGNHELIVSIKTRVVCCLLDRDLSWSHCPHEEGDGLAFPRSSEPPSECQILLSLFHLSSLSLHSFKLCLALKIITPATCFPPSTHSHQHIWQTFCWRTKFHTLGQVPDW